MAEVMGVSYSTVDQAQKEKETVLFLSPKKTVESGQCKSIDVFDQAAMKHKTTEFYTVKNQLLTLRTLHQRHYIFWKPSESSKVGA